MMNRRSTAQEINLPAHEETIAPVTILDGEGRVMRVVPAHEFRRAHVTSPPPTLLRWRRRPTPS
jgi:hypothetical protein